MDPPGHDSLIAEPDGNGEGTYNEEACASDNGIGSAGDDVNPRPSRTLATRLSVFVHARRRNELLCRKTILSCTTHSNSRYECDKFALSVYFWYCKLFIWHGIVAHLCGTFQFLQH